ncbi:MAG: glycosyltransferase family 4 protein [Leptolyngbyaceae bacterium]|nr:glycosyltransferase family 4 protein [Leptolyngbyaceae bacterium]
MHIAWLGKKTPFCGNVTYSREITNALLNRGHQVSFFHFEQVTAESYPKESLTNDWFSGSPPSPTWNSSPHSTVFSAAYGNDIHYGRGGQQRPASFHEVPIPYLYKSQIYTIPSLQSAKVLADALKQLKPDLIHASLTLSPLDFLLPDLCQELGIPLVATFHPAFDDKRRSLTSGTQHITYQIYAPFLANYDRVIVFSNIQRDMLIRLGVPPETVIVIPNGVDINKYSPAYSSIKTTLHADRLFVYQGRLSPEKNVEALLRAWKQCQLGTGAKLALVGDGPLAASLMSTYAAEDGIVWLGFIEDEQQRINILRGADVFILPSLIEGLSLSLLEAMACGVACLATDAGADGEVLAHGAGITLSTQRVTEQLQTLLPLCRDQPELTMILGQKARQRVLERYTLSHNISQVEEVYAQVLQRQQRSVYFEQIKAV